MTFEEYVELGGVCDSEIFNKLNPYVEEIIAGYIREHIPFWRVMPNLDDYGIDYKKPFVYELDFLESCGGIQSILGKSDFNFSSVSTSGFTYSPNTEKVEFYNGIPLSPLFRSKIDYELLRTGLGSMIA